MLTPTTRGGQNFWKTGAIVFGTHIRQSSQDGLFLSGFALGACEVGDEPRLRIAGLLSGWGTRG